jgi:environmental stress-induced protein Ves
MRLVRPDQWVAQPWKNGGGVTHELLREPADGDFALRISVADVAADGPFSRFPGIDRTIVMLQGNGFALRRDDGVHVRISEPGLPFSFHGEDAWSATLHDGPVRDFNVMADRARMAVSVQVHEGAFRLGPGRWLLFAVDAGARIDDLVVPRWGLFDGQGPHEVDAGRMLVIGVRPSGRG